VVGVPASGSVLGHRRPATGHPTDQPPWTLQLAVVVSDDTVSELEMSTVLRELVHDQSMIELVGHHSGFSHID
jgi:hypothetical protein